MGDFDSTLTLPPGRRRDSADSRDSHLVLVLDCNRPLASSTRYSLAHVATVTFGRAQERRFAFREEESERSLEIGLPDSWMSKNHARLRRILQHWVIEDAHSKNGTLVNGSRVDRVLLTPGDLIELGRTL